MKVNIRKLALELLSEYEASGKYVNLLARSPRCSSLSREELSALTALLYTTVEKKYTYDYFIGALSGRSLSDIGEGVRNILRLGMCQILDMRSIPDFAAVNETVKLADNPGERGFINAVLRTAARSKDELPYPDKDKKPLRYLAVKYSIPMGLVKRYFSIFGEDTERLLEAFSNEAALSLSVNDTKISRDEFLAKLDGLCAQKGKYTESGVVVHSKIAPTEIAGFNEGLFFVQDEASRVAVAALDIRPADTVVDVCAAPGGKSFLAAIAAKCGEVYSFELHESKISLIADGARRLGLDNLKISQRDAREPLPELFCRADKVICDVPCSGLGVIAKKPDLRYKELDSIKELPSLQYEILCASARYLKPGGTLLYSTCTLLPEENEQVIDKFVREHGDFEFVEFDIGDIRSECGKITLLPHVHGTDGFFAATVRRKR
jgi:16S rRNA (cytosine967-C5)-methyltransferase